MRTRIGSAGAACVAGIAGLLLATVTSEAHAYQRFLDGCDGCHAWTTAPYTSPKGYTIPVDLHDLHRSSSYMNADCNLCHTTGDTRNPYLKSSNGTSATTGYGCAGCHGNLYAGVVKGAGLRAHHARKGVTFCAGCHSSDPTAVPESTKPPYYGITAASNVDFSCNSDVSTSEDWTGDGRGLDNDGDGLVDGADPDCCVPATCAGLGKTCGAVADGCGGALSCGSCTAPLTCGGGGTANVCGCTPSTCAAQGKNCGALPDGCGGSLACGTCAAPNTCGGGGVANVCGKGTCTPTTCAAQGKNCGMIGDGCGGAIDCGSCAGPKSCGGGGVPNVCGCTPTTCAAQGLACGTAGDGCGATLDCGSCASGRSCVSGTCVVLDAGTDAADAAPDAALDATDGALDAADATGPDAFDAGGDETPDALADVRDAASDSEGEDAPGPPDVALADATEDATEDALDDGAADTTPPDGAETGDPGVTAPDAGGCGCQTTGDARDTGPFALALLGLASVIARRRRRHGR